MTRDDLLHAVLAAAIPAVIALAVEAYREWKTEDEPEPNPPTLFARCPACGGAGYIPVDMEVQA